MIDPRKKVKLSCQEAARKGLFVNGIYKHPYKPESSIHLDEAIASGFIVGKRVDLSKMDEIFKSWLTLPPNKPTRGVFEHSGDQLSGANNRQIKSASHHNFRDESLVYNGAGSGAAKVNKARRKKFTSEETILRSSIQPVSGKIHSVKDVLNERYLRLNEAERLGIINFGRGSLFFKFKFKFQSVLCIRNLKNEFHFST